MEVTSNVKLIATSRPRKQRLHELEKSCVILKSAETLQKGQGGSRESAILIVFR